MIGSTITNLSGSSAIPLTSPNLIAEAEVTCADVLPIPIKACLSVVPGCTAIEEPFKVLAPVTNTKAAIPSSTPVSYTHLTLPTICSV